MHITLTNAALNADRAYASVDGIYSVSLPAEFRVEKIPERPNDDWKRGLHYKVTPTRRLLGSSIPPNWDCFPRPGVNISEYFPIAMLTKFHRFL